MAYKITCIDETEPAPRRIQVELECDGHHHALPLIPRQKAVFRESGRTGHGYPELRREANAAGWRFVENGRVLGPCCPRPKTRRVKTHAEKEAEATEALRRGDTHL